MPELCRCCGQRPVPPAILRAQSGALRDLPAAQVPLCGLCWRAGCTGTPPCRVSAAEWAAIQQAETASRTWAAPLPAAPAAGPGAADTAAEWVAVAPGSWQKRVATAAGTLRAAIQQTTATTYHAQVVWVETADRFDLLPLDSLEHAQAACEHILRDFTPDLRPTDSIVPWRS